MGNYTEINVCFDLFKNTPEKIEQFVKQKISFNTFRLLIKRGYRNFFGILVLSCWV
jgi:hypothetical protein